MKTLSRFLVQSAGWQTESRSQRFAAKPTKIHVMSSRSAETESVNIQPRFLQK